MAGCRCAPSLLKLRQQVDFMWPGRDKASDGCCGDPAHASRTSDHNPTNGYAHALDIDEDILANMSGAPLWEFGIGLLTDSRVKYLIYEGKIMYPPDTIRPYYGVNAHKHHLHVSIKLSATHDTRPWPVPQPRTEEDPLLYKIWYVDNDNDPREWLVLFANGVPGFIAPLSGPREAQKLLDRGVVREKQEQVTIDDLQALTPSGP